MILVEGAVAKTSKYAVQESGDTAEMVERPRGGLSLIVADGQRSGKSAKAISNIVVRKAASLLLEGVRDGAAARAGSDYLLLSRRGQVSADLVILSVDMETRTLVITRNSHCPVLLFSSEGNSIVTINAESSPLGTSRSTRPQITELPLQTNLSLMAFTDGIWEAGTRSSRPTNVPEWINDIMREHALSPQTLADTVLAKAIELDQGRPRDDMTVAVLTTLPYDKSPEVRRLHVFFPVQ